MARTVVYEATPGSRSTSARDADGTASKIAKYVPAELVAIATLFFASFKITGSMIWVVVAIGAVLNVVYLLSVALSATNTPRPKNYFYVLSAVAFVLWCLATIDTVAKEAGLSGSTSDGQRAFVLAFAAFAMPLLDTLFSSIKLAKS